MRAVLFILATGLSLLACEKTGRVSQCRKLGQVVSEAMDSIEAANKANRPADYRSASQRYLALAKRARETRFATSAGQAAVEEYAIALESLAPSVATYADALEKGDQREQSEMRRDIERMGRREHAAAGRLDAFCRAP